MFKWHYEINILYHTIVLFRYHTTIACKQLGMSCKQ